MGFSANEDLKEAIQNSNRDAAIEVLQQINEISSNNARSVEEIAAAADHLNSMTDELNNKLEDFKTG
ncbi:MAG: hypothetical protein ACQESH_03060 [Campylobacterota bacterium]